MSDFETMEDFVAKVDWEGGVFSAMVYGLYAEDIPDDGSEESQELYDLWSEAQTAVKLVEQIERILSKYSV